MGCWAYYVSDVVEWNFLISVVEKFNKGEQILIKKIFSFKIQKNFMWKFSQTKMGKRVVNQINHLRQLT